MRKKVVAGNWKMNMSLSEGAALVSGILKGLPALSEGRQVVIAPPYLHLPQTITQIKGSDNVSVAAQNCHHEANGAYTGEVSAAMLRSAEVTHVIIGHSERREYNGETDAQLSKKVNAAFSAAMQVIFCCGEPLEVRDAGTQNDFVGAQLITGLSHLSAEQMQHIAIAYEPIWAIGTGRTASAQQAQDMHAHIRSVLSAHWNSELADNTSILYGGSCKPSNAAELFACPDVDGGLIGGASLKAEDFLGIITAMVEAQ